MRDYLKTITHVCPYSLESFDEGKVPVLKFSPELVETMYHDLKSYHAVVYKVHTSICRNVLESKAHELADEYPDAEWFWSHPADGNNSTPVPVLIMQNREHLASKRKEYKIKRYG